MKARHVTFLCVLLLTIGCQNPFGSSDEQTDNEPEQYTLTMEVNQVDWGIVSPDVGSHRYGENLTVTITATPAQDYRFVYWTGDVAEFNRTSTTVVVTGNMTVMAVFEKIKVYGSIKITGDFEAECTFDSDDSVTYEKVSACYNSECTQVGDLHIIDLDNNTSPDIWVHILLYETSAGLYQWGNDNKTNMYLQIGQIAGYRAGSGEITIKILNKKDIVGEFTGYLKSCDIGSRKLTGNKTIYVEGNFSLPR